MAQIAKKTITLLEGVVCFSFVDGTTRTVTLENLTPEIQRQLALHGLSQKLGDSYAGAESVSEAIERFNSTADMLLAGDWTSGRSASGGIWVDALARAANVDRSEALEKWNAMDDEAQKAVKAHAGVKAAKAAIELERAQAKAKAAGEAGGFDFDEL